MNLLLADKTTKLPEEKEREILKNAKQSSSLIQVTVILILRQLILKRQHSQSSIKILTY